MLNSNIMESSFRKFFENTEKYNVVTETNKDTALLFLTQGIDPSFKSKHFSGEYAPGRGISREGTYVFYPNVSSKGSYANVRLHLQLYPYQLEVSPEMKQLGYEDIDLALRSHDGAITTGRIPKDQIIKVEEYQHPGWKEYSPKEYIEKYNMQDAPNLPSVGEYETWIRKHADELFLSPRKIQDAVEAYRKASIKDKIELAKEMEDYGI